MRRYSSRMHKEKGSGRALGLDPFLDTVYVFFSFIFFFTCFYLHFILEF